MTQPRFFEELNSRVSELIASSPAKDVEKNLRLLLGSFFSRLDLVTREEFDIQAKVLARTREKIDALEARVAEMERKNTSAS
jgi:BMFP domain-containing protein YqiC